jgi:MSHA pilin protein MshD
MNNKPKGFTLIELIVGIVVLSISFSLIFTLILPLSEKSAEQLHQIRASELGQSMVNEILARAFDENSDMVGGLVRCSENGTTCKLPSELGIDSGETRHNFNDVDDYHDLDTNLSDDKNVLDEKFSSLYPGFRVRVSVCYSNFSGNCSTNIELAKFIVITITTPQNFDIQFSFYKANF